MAAAEAQPPGILSLTTHAHRGCGGAARGPAPRWAGLTPQAGPISWQIRAASSSFLPASLSGFPVARVSVCVRAAAAGRRNAGSPGLGCWRAARAVARRGGAGPLALGIFKFSCSWAACALLPVCLQRAPHRSALPSTPVLYFRWEMLLLDCNPEVRLRLLLPCRLKSNREG